MEKNELEKVVEGCGMADDDKAVGVVGGFDLVLVDD